MHTIEQHLSDTGLTSIEMVHLRTGDEAGDFPDEAPRLVFPNGHLEDIGRLTNTAAAMVAVAELEGQPLQISLHNSPNTYDLDHQTDCTNQVALAVSQRGDVPIWLAGHSKSWQQLVPVGDSFVRQGYPVEAVVGINPNGLTPLRYADVWAVGAKVVGAVVEASIQDRRARELGLAHGSLALAAGRHALGNVLGAVREYDSLLRHNVIDDTVALHKRLAESHGQESRMRIIASDADRVCPGRTMLDNLTQAGYPSQDYIRVNTSHSDLVLDPRYAPGLLDVMLLRDEHRLPAEPQHLSQ